MKSIDLTSVIIGVLIGAIATFAIGRYEPSAIAAQSIEATTQRSPGSPEVSSSGAATSVTAAVTAAKNVPASGVRTAAVKQGKSSAQGTAQAIGQSIGQSARKAAVKVAAAPAAIFKPAAVSKTVEPKTRPADKKLDFAALENPGLIPATAPPGEDQKDKQIIHALEIRPGDTLMKVMLDAGAARGEAHAAITALTKVYNPRRLRPGQALTLTFREDLEMAGGMRLLAINFQADVEADVVVERTLDEGPFQARRIEKQLTRRTHHLAGRISDSLFLSAERAGLPPQIIIDLIRLYSFDVDFQRDIQPGDQFEVLYDSLHDEFGDAVKHGDIKFARLRVGSVDLQLYRYTWGDGELDYFDEKGRSVRKTLMKTPVDGARLSSRFGRRRHPILKYTRMHRGIDFAAPSGTPIMAAGDGKITYAGRKGGYGKYVQIRHNGELSTAYAHMRGYGRGIRKGKRVRQGQIIGYIGTTGRSTGPHLHYEIIRNGRQINPLTLKLPTGRKLKGKNLRRFMGQRDVIRTALAAQPLNKDVAGK